MRVLVGRGHEVVCFVRRRADRGVPPDRDGNGALGEGATARLVDVSSPASIARDGFRGERFDAVISCMASRTGAPKDAWAIDYRAHADVLAAARDAGVSHFVQLSAICVQKPLLAFQHAKLAFEAALVESGVKYSIVRPTAFFKSLSGQIERVRRGKPFLVFGDGLLTACKPIGDNDLAVYLADCLADELRWKPCAPHRRARGCDHAAAAGRIPVFPPGPPASLPQRTCRDARHHYRRPRPVRPDLVPPRRKGGTGPHRALLRDRIHAVAQSRNGRLRRRGDAIDRHGDALRLLQRRDSRGRRGGARGSRGYSEGAAGDDGALAPRFPIDAKLASQRIDIAYTVYISLLHAKAPCLEQLERG